MVCPYYSKNERKCSLTRESPPSSHIEDYCDDCPPEENHFACGAYVQFKIKTSIEVGEKARREMESQESFRQSFFPKAL